MHSETHYLTPTAPFDFGKSLDFLGVFTPMRGDQTLSARTLTKAIYVEGQAVAFHLMAMGTVEQPKLECILFSEKELSTGQRAAALDRIGFFLSLYDDLQPFYQAAEHDPYFATVLEKLYGYHQVKFVTPFENAVWSILSQRNTFPIATRWKQLLSDKYGSRIEVNGTLYRTFPEPEQILATPPGELQAMIPTMRRAEYLITLAEAFSTVDEMWLRTGNYTEVLAWLRKIKGIGEWSASFIMLRGLGRMNRIPVNEERHSDSVLKVYGQNSPEIIQQISSRYGDTQGYWAHYLRVGA